MRRKLVLCVAVLVLGCWGAFAAEGDEPELDPLLELLVEQGVITLDQATAVQAEYDAREGKTTPPPAAPAVMPGPDEAPPAAPQEKEKKEKWYDRIDFRGDLRLRLEAFHQEGISDNNWRDRYRLRIRPGIYTDITDWMEVGLQLRSGDPRDPVSDNQTIEGGFSLKAIAISEGFAGFHPTGWLDLTIGKFDAKKKWVVSDMHWDDDVTVEGAMQELSFGPLKFDLYQYTLEEVKDEGDAYLLGGQAYGSFGSDAVGTFRVGAGYDNWVRPQLVADLTLSGELHGNKISNLLTDDNQLVSDFQIVNVFATWSYKRNERWPLKASLFGYHNTGARSVGKDYDDGYFVRFQVGDYKKKGQLMFRLSRYYSEPDALFYVFAQSDTTRASDVDAYRFDFRMGYVKRSYFNLTWYHVDSVLRDTPTLDRFQLDYIIVF